MEHTREKEIPKWIGIPVGVLLGLITLLCMFGSVTLLISPPESGPLFSIAIGVILVVGCLWVLRKCACMVLGLGKKEDLLAPRSLRVVAFFFLLLPVIGIFTGYYSSKGYIAIVQAIGCIGVWTGLIPLARRRESRKSSDTAAGRNVKGDGY